MCDSINVEWGVYILSDIFEISSTKSGIDKNKLVLNDGKTPYITRTDNNNGWERCLGEQNSRYKIDLGNCITIGLDTQTVFYQPINFYTGQNIQTLRNKHLNKYNAMFIISMIDKLMGKFNWGGNGATLTRLKRSKILLPKLDDGHPDYLFMERYIKAKNDTQFLNYAHRIQNRNKANDSSKSIKPLSEKEWKGFYIGDIFTLQVGRSKGLNHLKTVDNGVSYLGATNRNNGVLEFVEPVRNLIQDGNAIAFIRNGEGSMGYSVYKKEPFIATSDITVGYNDKLNPYIGMFITTIADKVRGKYNFGYKRSDTRLKKETVQLPIDKDGNPDYQYMEQYMKLIERRQIRAYLEYIDNRQ